LVKYHPHLNPPPSEGEEIGEIIPIYFLKGEERWETIFNPHSPLPSEGEGQGEGEESNVIANDRRERGNLVI